MYITFYYFNGGSGMTQAERDIRQKLKVLNHAIETKNISKTCRYFGITRETFYQWKRAYNEKGETGLINRKPCPENPKLRTPLHIEKRILYLRKTYHLGPVRIAWYLERYHQIKISSGGVYFVLKRNGMNRLPKNTPKRSVTTHRYEKQVPGHHIQVDVKFLKLDTPEDTKVKRYQYTAIDDATRIRALKIYSKHNQKNAIDFIDYVVEKFPFRIHTVRTDNGHEFQAKFHWHLADIGINHVYIKPRSPHLNGKVERSHSTDNQEFYQLLSYTDDVDLNQKLSVWENFYNLSRPHSSLKGKTPYESLREKLKDVA
jgi:transposase InsO family protein